jgi:DNA helicase-2/ATP-dependent DNA helicase PcrA
VQFLKEILPVDNGLASHMTTYNPAGEPFTITKYPDQDTEADQVLRSVKDPAHTAIIARTNRQLFVFQRLCTMRGIKYNFLGKKDFFEQNEVKKLLELAKKSGDTSQPANSVLTQLINQHNLIHIYSQAGSNPMEASPVENLNSIVKMSAGKGTMPEFLNYLRKLTHARKKSSGTLTLTTVHQAKGLEFDVVYVVGARQGTMPHQEGELMEEARIFFVACSRAARELHISFYDNPSMYLNAYVDRIEEYELEESNG